MMLGGIPVYANSLLCDGGKFLRWRKNHRKSRINKKWHKKYGFEVTQCSNPAFRVGDKLIVCPHAMRELEKTIGARRADH